MDRHIGDIDYNKEGIMSSDNTEKLKELLIDILLLNPSEFRFDLKRDEVDSWDSLAVVSIAVGIQEVFGYHFTPEEATAISGVKDIVKTLDSKGISFE